MPLIKGRMRYWWNWSARTLKTGRLVTRFTDGGGHITTPDQLFAWVKKSFPHLRMEDFTCEPADSMPSDKRDLVPHEDYMDDWQLSLYRRLTDQDDSFADAGSLV